MSDDFKKTYDGFTKFVLWGTIAVIAILVILAIALVFINVMQRANENKKIIHHDSEHAS